jgi:hypothetical protein
MAGDMRVILANPKAPGSLHRPLLLHADGDDHREDEADIPGRFDPHRPTMPVDEATRDRKAQTPAALLARVGVVDLLELVEDALWATATRTSP